MSKPASKTLIGAFVLGALALAVAAVLVLGSGKFFGQKLRAVCYFRGSVQGLNIGAPVAFRGVRVGSVTDIDLIYQTKDHSFNLPVFIEIDAAKMKVAGPLREVKGGGLQKLIADGLRAELQMQSFVTGQMQVGLDLHPETPARAVHGDTGVVEIPTIATALEELTRKIDNIPVDEIVSRLLSTLSGIEKIVNSPEIPKTLHSVSQAAEEARAAIQSTNGQLATLSASMDAAVKDMQKLVQNLNSRIDPIGSSVQKILNGMDGLLQNDVTPLVRDVNKVTPQIIKDLEVLRETLEETRSAVRAASATAGPESPLVRQMTVTLQELSGAARALRTLADYLERHPEAVLKGKPGTGGP